MRFSKSIRGWDVMVEDNKMDASCVTFENKQEFETIQLFIDNHKLAELFFAINNHLLHIKYFQPKEKVGDPEWVKLKFGRGKHES